MGKRKIKKVKRIVGIIGNKRIKTTYKKWEKIINKNPELTIKFSEDSLAEQIKEENKELEKIKQKRLEELNNDL